ncbi:hypothetical protein BpHYR1_015528 [Brachionus plicatilis]|uniref:Uncharacterized protein n=1 Tax=Brachionus plicatilis TaxID=10195 RepID=A0A3M7RJY2_BRAPC|nr:hypothetical protein BpHYR1_015528 [Brachionus plicatilis]
MKYLFYSESKNCPAKTLQVCKVLNRLNLGGTKFYQLIHFAGQFLDSELGQLIIFLIILIIILKINRGPGRSHGLGIEILQRANLKK